MLTLEQVEAITLAHKGPRRDRFGQYLPRAPYYWNGPRGRACCVHVFSGDRADTGGHRCGKIAAVTETVEGKGDLDFCNFHASSSVAKREAAQAVRDEAQRAKWSAAAEARRLARLAPGFVAALQQIADGDNDPRRTARIALGLDAASNEERY